MALLYVMFLSHSQITHLSIWCPGSGVVFDCMDPDLCLLHYFNVMYTYAKFDQNIPCG